MPQRSGGLEGALQFALRCLEPSSRLQTQHLRMRWADGIRCRLPEQGGPDVARIPPSSRAGGHHGCSQGAHFRFPLERGRSDLP
ncbi:hypothetical protein MBTS_22345 [Methylobacterium bullatum]|nr:hypothetical protein [Methylobacterium bullatum]